METMNLTEFQEMTPSPFELQDLLDSNTTGNCTANVTGNVTRGGGGGGGFPLWYHVLFLIAVTIGYVFNPLCFIVMRRPSLSGLTISVYLSVLAVVDFLVQIAELYQWLLLTGNLVVNHSFATCQIQMITVNGLLASSNWILSAVSFERFYSVYYPIKARFLCTIEKAVIGCLVVVAVSFFLRLSNLWVMEVIGTHCMVSSATYFSRSIQPLMEAMLITGFPSILITSFNVAIAVKIQKKRIMMKRQRQQLERQQQQSEQQQQQQSEQPQQQQDHSHQDHSLQDQAQNQSLEQDLVQVQPQIPEEDQAQEKDQSQQEDQVKREEIEEPAQVQGQDQAQQEPETNGSPNGPPNGPQKNGARQKIKKQKTASESNRDARDQKVINMLLLTSGIFFFLCVPNCILHIIFVSGVTANSTLFKARIIAFLISKFNNSVNFFAYVLSSADFRQEFVKLVTKACPGLSRLGRRRQSHSEVTTVAVTRRDEITMDTMK